MRGAEVKGVEALSRGVREDGQLVDPEVLFGAAEAQGLAGELDRLCWRNALQGFRPLHQRNRELVLFVNLHAASADDLSSPDGFVSTVQTLGLDPRAVAVEVLESQFGNDSRLHELTRALRRSGFLLALDDMGTGHSNLERVLQVRPDVLKVDRSLVRGLHEDFYKR